MGEKKFLWMRSFNLCVSFITETYTLLGNSFGFPCVFPFKYNNKWYYECTRDGKEFEWCATTSYYEQDEKWGFCPGVGKALLVFTCIVFFFLTPGVSVIFINKHRTRFVVDYKVTSLLLGGN